MPTFATEMARITTPVSKRTTLPGLLTILLISIPTALLTMAITHVNVLTTLQKRLHQSTIPHHTSLITLTNVTTRISPGNKSCIITACQSRHAPGAEHFWNYYRRQSYTLHLYIFDTVTHAGKRAAPAWCRVPAAQTSARKNPNSRIIYADLDTKINVDTWCNLPYSSFAPIIMNSLARGRTSNEHFAVHGSQVQANVFATMPGRAGFEGLLRWEAAYWNGPLHDQGAIHRLEHGLCGVPGWIACYRNPDQQRCHCFGGKPWKQKDDCIRDLFLGNYTPCAW